MATSKFVGTLLLPTAQTRHGVYGLGRFPAVSGNRPSPERRAPRAASAAGRPTPLPRRRRPIPDRRPRLQPRLELRATIPIQIWKTRLTPRFP